jgi:hypothetical protein
MRLTRPGLLLGLLMLAALACNLQSGEKNDRTVDIPTAPPTGIAALPSPSPTWLMPPTTTAASPLTPGVTSAACVPRTDWPVMTVASGETLFVVAQLVGASPDELARANCLPVGSSLTAGQRLFVPRIPASAPTQTLGQNCGAAWFFTFDEGQLDPRAACPNPVRHHEAIGQNFEGGRVLVYGALPGETDPRGTVYVVYNDRSWETFPNTWDPSQPELDPALAPPPDRVQPVRQIGKVWRENPAVRAKLGWAYAPEEPFDGRYQDPATQPPGDAYFYLDHGAFDVVLRYYSVNMGPNRWEIAGHY